MQAGLTTLDADARWPGHLAAVDMGSNSFRLEIGEVAQGRYRRIDYLKETVRLGAGLDAEGLLTDEAAARGLTCLGRFAQRLEGYLPQQVRVVAPRGGVALEVQSFGEPLVVGVLHAGPCQLIDAVQRCSPERCRLEGDPGFAHPLGTGDSSIERVDELAEHANGVSGWLHQVGWPVVHSRAFGHRHR